jgi:uncharacterized membrane protein
MAQVSSDTGKADVIASDSLKKVTKPLWFSRQWVDAGIGIVLFGVAMALNLRHLGTPSIWFDEAFSVELARQPLPLLWHIIFGLEPNMELYYLFLHFWLMLTGAIGLLPTEVVVRFPSTIFAALSTVSVFYIGRRFITTFAGVLAAGFYLLNYLQLVYAQQTRSYSLQLLCICLAWYALLMALSDVSNTRTRRWWIGYVVAITLAMYAHLFTVLILFSQLVAVAGIQVLPSQWRATARTQLRSYIVSLFATGVLIIPMLLVSQDGAKTGWLSIPHWHDVSYLFQTLSGYSKTYLLVMAVCSGAGVLLVALAYALLFIMRSAKNTRYKRNEVEAASQLFPFMFALLCWFVIPIVVSYVVSHSSLRLFSTRYLVAIVPPLCLLMGLGVSMLRLPTPLKQGKAIHFEKVMQCVLGLVLLALAFPSVSQYYRSAQVEDWNSVSHWIMQQYQSGDGLVCYDNDVQQGCQISVQYYFDAYPSAAHFTADTPGAFSWTNFAAARADAAVDPTVLAVYGAKHPRIMFIVGRLPDDRAAAKAQAAQQWLDSHYHLVGKLEKTTVTVRLYSTGG